MRRRLRWTDAPVGGVRARDANAGAPGKWPQTVGGINPEGEFEADAFSARRQRVRLRGVDQAGENWGAELWLPTRQGGYGSAPAKVGDAAIGAAALDHPERSRDGCEEISAIAELQRRLNAHYGQ
jgi:hypothetical protein